MSASWSRGNWVVAPDSIWYIVLATLYTNWSTIIPWIASTSSRVTTLSIISILSTLVLALHVHNINRSPGTPNSVSASRCSSIFSCTSNFRSIPYGFLRWFPQVLLLLFLIWFQARLLRYMTLLLILLWLRWGSHHWVESWSHLIKVLHCVVTRSV